MKQGVTGSRYRKETRLCLFFLLAGILFYAYQNIFLAWQHYHTNDFKHMYLGAKMLRFNLNPYHPFLFLKYAQIEGFARINPFVYPTFSGIFFLPLSYLTFESAKNVWFVLNHIFIITALLLLVKTLFPKSLLKWSAFLILAAAASHPVYRTLTAGQFNAFLLLLYTLIFISWKKNAGHWLAFLIAFGGMVKILPFFMGILLLERKNWKYLAEFFGWLIVLNLISIGICGWETHWAYTDILLRMGFGSSAWYEFGARFHIDAANQSAAAFLLRNFTENEELIHPLVSLPFNAVKVFFYTFVLAAIGYGFVLLKRLPSHLERPRTIFFVNVMLINFLVPTIVWDHYFMILFPVILLQAYLLDINNDNPVRIREAAFLFLPVFVLLGFTFLTTAPFADYYLAVFLLLAVFQAWIISRNRTGSLIPVMILLLTWLGFIMRFPYYDHTFNTGWKILLASNKFYILALNLLIFNYLQYKQYGQVEPLKQTGNS